MHTAQCTSPVLWSLKTGVWQAEGYINVDQRRLAQCGREGLCLPGVLYRRYTVQLIIW